MSTTTKAVVAIFGLVILVLFNGSLGALSSGSDFYPLAIIWSALSGGVYGFVAMMWVMN